MLRCPGTLTWLGWHAAQVEEALEAFIEEQIIKHEENKWGNKLSNKLFVAREFVVKHIRNKHGHVLDAERDKVQDAIYWDNFRCAAAWPAWPAWLWWCCCAAARGLQRRALRGQPCAARCLTTDPMRGCVAASALAVGAV